MPAKTVSHLNIETSISPETVPASPYIPGSGNVFAKFVDAISQTGWELWYFDGVSKDDQSAISIGINRSARGLKHGGFTVQIFAIWPDGHTWHRDLYFPESTVTSEDGHITGLWEDAGSGGKVSFSVTRDCSVTMLTFAVPGVVDGTMHLETLPGDSGLETNPELGPRAHIVRPKGRASVKAELSLSSGDNSASERFVLGPSANGGMDRIWTLDTWPKVMTESYYLRAQVGPYAMQITRLFSEAESGCKPYTMARLYRDGKLICAANQVLTYEEQDFSKDSLILSKRYDASSEDVVTGAYRDKNIGYVVEFVAKGTDGQRWMFQVDHERIFWSYPTSAPGPEGTGNTGFIESVIGGADEEAYFGVGIGGQCQLS
ncbi:uncharacterized protein FFB20_03036 [Fusarium fujikuroi]|uniref:Diels-Alderase n=1 Tax=Fusarium fujikuroi TaxID=5127 RepID=A0A2H3SN47_FUSFU|nr:uncharacterized protein Y057_4920 [Fusarium fujikuroi]QGI61441.1 hypothetical protein CEK27_005412 [Fusarium fujikuroi]QGI92339.1 hypothetical protein CEK26_005408 [Fusarium fujikuroi]SCN68475.1 uncharacterized protein FFB20_03036 [Fusarium fujikuroi]SCO16954.1 uncharacterized protein FFE2_13668 [Fusarium fujikuroi]